MLLIRTVPAASASPEPGGGPHAAASRAGPPGSGQHSSAHRPHDPQGRATVTAAFADTESGTASEAQTAAVPATVGPPVPTTTTTGPPPTTTTLPVEAQAQVAAPAPTTTTTEPASSGGDVVTHGIVTFYAHPAGRCASPWIRFGTVVRITNPANGRSVSCVVDDYEADTSRSVDLATATFAEIAPLSQGVIDAELSW